MLITLLSFRIWTPSIFQLINAKSNKVDAYVYTGINWGATPAPDVFAPSCLIGVTAFTSHRNEQALDGWSYPLIRICVENLNLFIDELCGYSLVGSKILTIM